MSAIDSREANFTRDPHVFTEAEEKELDRLKVDAGGYVPLSDITVFWMGEQSQYVAYFLHTFASQMGVVYVGEGLDFVGDNAHTFKIHADDVREFIARVREWRWTHYLPSR